MWSLNNFVNPWFFHAGPNIAAFGPPKRVPERILSLESNFIEARKIFSISRSLKIYETVSALQKALIF
jgi:hypothetical protein